MGHRRRPRHQAPDGTRHWIDWQDLVEPWVEVRRLEKGQANRPQRFKAAGQALGEARRRNRPVSEGGAAATVLVEGPRDRRTLRRMGFTGVLEQVNRGWSRPRLIAHLCEIHGHLAADGGPVIILLMDWDRTGGRMQYDLRKRLEGMDIRVDDATRAMLLRALKPETCTVEGMLPHAEELVKAMDLEDPEGALEAFEDA